MRIARNSCSVSRELKRRARLVHQHESLVARGRLDDLDHLGGGDAEPAHRRFGIDVEIELRAGGCASATISRRRRKPRAERALAPDEQVLPDLHVGDRQQFLRDDRDAERAGVARIEGQDRDAVDGEDAAVRRELARDDLEQGRLAGAVLARQYVDGAGLKRAVSSRSTGMPSKPLQSRLKARAGLGPSKPEGGT